MTYLSDLMKRYTIQVDSITDKTFICNPEKFGVGCGGTYWPTIEALEEWNVHRDNSFKKVKGRAKRVSDRLSMIEFYAYLKKSIDQMEAQL